MIIIILEWSWLVVFTDAWICEEDLTARTAHLHWHLVRDLKRHTWEKIVKNPDNFTSLQYMLTFHSGKTIISKAVVCSSS